MSFTQGQRESWLMSYSNTTFQHLWEVMDTGGDPLPLEKHKFAPIFKTGQKYDLEDHKPVRLVSAAGKEIN